MALKSKTYTEISYKKEPVLKTGDETLDNFLSNDKGFVLGSSIFLTGTSGAGKTTFAFTLQKLLKDYRTSLYSREMSASSVKQQMKRYELNHANAYIADKEMCPTIQDYINEIDILKPKAIIIDSLQVILKEDCANQPVETAGFETIQVLRDWAEKNSAILIMVGHVNKDGGFEGKNTIKHMFDAHLEMIFDEKNNTRTISFSKNRKGDLGKLFYSFGKEKIEFFTEKEWKNKDNSISLFDHMTDALVDFVKMQQKTKNYTNIKKEIKKSWNSINPNLSENEIVFQMMEKLNEIL